MAVSYNPLWKLLIDRKIQKKGLCEMAGISKGTINRMVRGENISVDVLEKICLALGCGVQDILDFQHNEDT